MRHLQGDWLEIAKKLPQGSKIRTRCSEPGCGKDNSQLISHDERGYRAWCFRCRIPKFEGHGLRSIELIERHKKERAIRREARVELPADYTLEVPARAAIWYYKYGISAELAASYGIGYTPDLDRVVLPVYEEDELIALQMRAVDPWRKPKYLNPQGPRVSSALFESAPATGVTIVVEDILSAIKVGRVHHCTSILGTTMTDQRALKIAERNQKAIIWLDGDKAGAKGASSAERQLQLFGVDVSRITTSGDPKTYSLEAIRSIIEND
jgi:DNA primase